eukprot:scaffold22728_cov48-Cyclotella_meneghiniana.AAC.7
MGISFEVGRKLLILLVWSQVMGDGFGVPLWIWRVRHAIKRTVPYGRQYHVPYPTIPYQIP